MVNNTGSIGYDNDIKLDIEKWEITINWKKYILTAVPEVPTISEAQAVSTVSENIWVQTIDALNNFFKVNVEFDEDKKWEIIIDWKKYRVSKDKFKK
jgi:hypothetical protein